MKSEVWQGGNVSVVAGGECLSRNDFQLECLARKSESTERAAFTKS
jgi:hypothetical protein